MTRPKTAQDMRREREELEEGQLAALRDVMCDALDLARTGLVPDPAGLNAHKLSRIAAMLAIALKEDE